MTGHLYATYGLIVAMPFACPEMVPADADSIPDVDVVEGEVPLSIPQAQLTDIDLELSPGTYLLRHSAAGARFLVEDGRRVTFERLRAAPDALIRHVLTHQVMAALLRQRGMLVLHASGAVSPDGVVLIGGESGAGKSTTTAALTQLGWPLQTDDISALRLDAEGKVEVLPGARDLHLFRSASDALALDTGGVVPNAWHRSKLALPALVEPRRQARPLHRIVHLERGTQRDIEVERLVGRAKLPILLHGLYGPYLPRELASGAGLVSHALNDVEMIRIIRPDTEWTMDQVVAAIAA